MAVRHRTVALVCAATVYAFSHRMSVVPFYEFFMKRYGATYAGAGALLSAFFAGYAVSMMPAGVLADRFPARDVLVVGIGLVGASATVFALSADYGVALAARFAVGIGVALFHPAAIKLLAATSEGRSLGFAVGLRESSAGAGILVALTLFPVLAIRFHPSYILLAAGLACIPVASGFMLLPRAAAAGRRRGCSGLDPGIPARRDVLLLAAASFFGLFGINGFVGWFPVYLESGLGMGKTATGMIMAGNMAAMIAVALCGGRLSDALGRRPVAIAGSSGLAVTIASLWLLRGTSPLAAALAAGAASALATPPIVALAAEIAEVERAGAVTGFVTAVGQMASALAAWLLGRLVDVTGGFGLVLAAMVASLAVEVMLLTGVREPRAGLRRTGCDAD